MTLSDNVPGRFKAAAIRPSGGVEQWWIFTPDEDVHDASFQVLRGLKVSTQRTYAHCLADHLNFLWCNGLREQQVTKRVLQRYMAGLTGDTEFGAFGLPWRGSDRQSVGPDHAGNVATVVRAYYNGLSADGVIDNPELIRWLEGRPTCASRGGREGMYTNPLAPSDSPSPRPRIVATEEVEALFDPGVLKTARDRMILTWLADSGIRVGGLCGLRHCDLHLQVGHSCMQRRDPHVHIIPRDDNPGEARAKAYYKTSYTSRDGVVVNGVIRMVSPQMISTYHEYLLDERFALEPVIDHDQVLVQLGGRRPGAALTTTGVRQMLRRACRRAGMGDAWLTPHAFRHRAAAKLYAESDFNAQLVADEFGWADAKMVTDRYGRAANGEAAEALRRAWERSDHPSSSPHLEPTGVRQ